MLLVTFNGEMLEKDTALCKSTEHSMNSDKEYQPPTPIEKLVK